MFQATFLLKELEQIVTQLLKVKHHKIVLLQGEMGAGKTTLIKELVRQLGVSENTNSPTYLIVNQYETNSKEVIYHFDAYRLEDEEEAFAMGFDEYLDSGNYCFIEWPDRMASILPEEHSVITIKKVEEGKRLVSLT